MEVSSWILEALFVSCIVLIWCLVPAVLSSARRGGEVERLRREIELLERERERLRQHYESLLRDAVVRNEIALALYDAWRSGRLRECYAGGGDVRVLADGTVVCELPERERSYAIPRGERR